LARHLKHRSARLYAGVAALSLLAHVATPSCAFADTIAVTDQTGFAGAVADAITGSGQTTITASGGGAFAAGADWSLPGNGSSVSIIFDTSPFVIGNGDGDSTVTLGTGASVTLDTTSGSDAAWMTIGDGGTGSLTIAGGSLQVNVADPVTAPIGRVVIGAGSGGTGTLAISSGSATIETALVLGGTAGSTGTVNLTGGTLSLAGSGYLSFGAGTGTFNLSGGTLSVGGTDGIRGTGTLNLGGGTLQVAGSALSTSTNAVLVSGKNSTIDTNGLGATFSGILSGAGSLTKTGEGTLTLTGENSYSGGTTITSGTLAIGNGSNRGNITGDIANSGTLQFSRSDSLTYAGTISGTGGVTLTVGVLTLTGENTFTGAINLTGGIFTIGNGGTTGSVASQTITTSAGSTLLFRRSDDITYSGVISGAGALTKGSAGTLTLTGNNTYTGLTTVSTGTLQIGNGATSGAIAGNVTINSNATLAFKTDNDVSYGGTISSNTANTGNLRKEGSGTLILTGTSSFTGTTTISGGTLQLGNGGTTGSVNGNIVNNATLAFSRSNNITFSKVISGTGNVTVAAASGSSLILTGANTYTGGTTVTLGTLQVGNGTAGSIAGDVSVAAGAKLVFLRNDTVTFAGAVSGAGTLTKSGTGTLVLTGASTLTGGTTISAGTLQIGSGGTTGSLAGDIVNDAALVFDRSDTVTQAGAISGTGTLEQAGSGTLILTGTNSHSGGTSVTGGILQIGDGGTTGAVAGDIALGASTGLVFNRSDDIDHSGAITGSGGVTQAGPGVLTLSGSSNSYTGGTTISGGTLQIADDGALGDASGGLTFDGGTLATTATFASARAVTLTGSGTFAPDTGTTLTLNGVISGSGSLTKTGAGTLVLSGTNTYSGGTTVSSGTLQVAADASLGGAGSLVLDGGTFASSADMTSSRAVVLSASSTISPASATTLTLSGVMSGAGDLTKAGTGTLVLSGTNTFTGATLVSAGTLSISGGAALSDAAGVTIATGATLSLGSSSETVGSLSGGGSLSLGSGRLTAGGDDSDTTFSGVASGTGGLTKAGAGTLVLSGANTYTGGTTIAGGTLQIGAGGTTGTVAGDISNDSALVFNRSNSITYADVISGTGSVTQAGSGILTLSGSNSFSGGLFISSGTVSVGDDGNMGATSGAVTLSGGGILSASAVVSTDRTFHLGTGGGTINANSSNSVTLTGDVDGTGGLTKTGSATLTLSGTTTYTGLTTVSAGTLQIKTTSFSSDIVNNAVVDFSSNLTYAGAISGTGRITKTGTGTLILRGENTYSGTTTISAGTLQVASATALGSGTMSLGGGTLSTTDTFTYGKEVALTSSSTVSAATGTTLTLSGVVSGTGSGLTANGAGTLVLSGVNTYGGGTTISGGTVQIAANSGLGATSGTVTFSGGTLAVTGTFTNSRVTTLSASGGTIAPSSGTTLTWNGKISGDGALNISGAGTLVLGGINDYTGGTTIHSGTVSINAETRLGDKSGALTMAGGTLVINSSITIAREISLTGAATISPSGTTTISSGMTGAGSLTKSGAGTLILTGASTYSGGTTISSGTLQIGNAGTTGSIAGNVTNNAALTFSRSDTFSFGGTISGTGTVSHSGGGTLTLTGTNTYSGGTTVSSGTLSISADANLGDASGGLTLSGSSSSLVTTESFTSGRAVTLANGFIKPAAGTTLTLSGVLSGTALRMAGAGTLILSGTNTYTGNTSITTGTLQVSADANLGAGSGISLTNGTLATTETFSSARTVSLSGTGTFTPSTGTTLTLTGVISGSAGLTKAGTGTLVLSGTNTYTGGTTISAGTLDVAGSVEGVATVEAGATLKGSGSIAGLVTVADGGTLAGAQGSGLTMGGLVLSSGSTLDVALGASSGGGVFTVNGDLTLDGTLTVTKLNDFGAGVYRVIDYTGTLTDDGLDLASLGSGYLSLVQTSQSGEVNLVVEAYDSALQFWNGSATTATGTIEGGDGTWTASPDSTNWTVASGAIPLASSGGFAIFQGAAGTVTIDTGAGDVTATGLQFVTSGYTVTGGTLTLTGDAPATVRVGDGTEAGAATVATIESVIAGTSGLNKTDLGTLILSGENTYTGGTTLSGGTLRITADSALGDASGGLTFDGGTLAVGNDLDEWRDVVSSRDVVLTGTGTFAPDGASALTLSGVISGTGSLVMSGDGFLILTGTNTYSGGTTVSAGVLQVGADAALGDASGGVTLSGGALMGTDTFSSARTITMFGTGTIAPDAGTTLTLTGDISGTAALVKDGAGTLVLSGTNSYVGDTTVLGGTLQIATNEALGDVTKQLSLSGTLKTTATFSSARAINLGSAGGTISTDSGTTLTLSGVLSGNSGKLAKTGDGTLVLTGSNTYTGGTTISAGTLQIGADSALGNASGSLKLSGGTLATTATFSSARAVSLTSASSISTATGTTLTLTGVVSGIGALTKTGSGTLVLSGTNSYQGGTTISGGRLEVSSDASLGNQAGGIAIDGGTLAASASFSSGRSVTITGAAAFYTAEDTTLTLTGRISGTGGLTKTGDGTLVLSGDNGYEGGTTISAGTLQVSSDGSLGDEAGGLAIDGATLAATASFSSGRSVTITGAAAFYVTQDTTLTLTGEIAGTGGLTKTGEGTLALSGANSFEGATTVEGGTLALNGGESLADDARLTIAADATVTLGDADETVGSLAGAGSLSLGSRSLTAGGDDSSSEFAGEISGTGGLVKTGTGTLTLSGDNGFSGDTTVSAGTLDLTGSLAGGATVESGATLEGSGSIAGTTAVEDGGTIAGVQGSGLTLGGLSLAAGANVDVTLGATSDGGVFTVNGDVTLDGTLTVTKATGFGVGVYTFISYTGSLTDNGMTVASLGSSYIGGVQTSVAGEVNLIVEDSNVPILFWNGATTTPTQTVEGGSGTWTASPDTNWTNASGTIAQAWNGGFAIFQGTAGTVTVDDGDGAVSVTGLQFVTSGYVVTGDTLTLSGPDPVTIRVGDGTESGADMVATIDSVLAGTAGLEKTDHGTLVLSGENTYSGGTTISGGTLEVSSDANLGDASGGLTLTGGTLATTASFASSRSVTITGAGRFYTDVDTTLTLSGAISGTGGLAKSGDGTLVLSGENTYSGGTTISGGTLEVSSDANLGDASGGLTLAGGTLATTASFASSRSVTITGTGRFYTDVDTTLTLSGAISGTGGLAKAGDGTLELSGENTYSGGTTISGGTLQVSSDGNLGDGTGGLAIDGGTLAATASFSSERSVSITGAAAFYTAEDATLSLSGAISGTGGLVKTGDGTLALSGTNGYQGGTTISGGTLEVSADANLGAASGGLAIDGGTLAATASFTSGRSVTVTGAAAFYTAADTTLTLSGAISGTGGLTKTGDGTLILTADASYAGTTTILAGTLQIGDGGTTGSVSGDIVNEANLVFNRSDSYTIAGNITGSGTLTLSGGGTATFGSSYAGEVKLEDATAVLVDGTTTTADFVIGDGGVLGGSATIGSLTANAGGTVAPGYSPGTLTVDGPVAFNAGSVYSVDVTPDGSHDVISASGDVTLSSGASVEVVAADGAYDRQSSYTILTTSGTVTGTFGSVSTNLAFLRPTLTYDTQNVYLGLVYTGGDFADYARTVNQIQAAGAAQALGEGNAIFEGLLLLAEDAVAPALDQLTGEIYPTVSTVIQQQSVHLREAIGGRLRQSETGGGSGALARTAKAAGAATVALDPAQASVLWAQGYGGWGEASASGTAAGVSSATGGIFGGLDGEMNDVVRAGIVAGYGRTLFDVDGRSSAGSMNSFDLGVYAGGQFGAFGLRGGASYTLHDVEVERTVAFGTLSERQSAGYLVGTTQVFGEAAYRVGLAGYAFEPFASLAYVDVSGASVREGGSGAAGLAVDVDGQETFYTTLGARLATTFDLGGGTLTPSVTVGWQHASGDTTPTATMRFLAGSTAFDIQGMPIAESTVVVGAGFVYGLSDSLTLQMNYAGQFAAGASSNAFAARFSQRF